MCNTVYLSTTYTENLSVVPSELYRLVRLAAEDEAAAVVNRLSHPVRWYLESQYGGCSCHFRHLCEGNDLAFSPPEDWCPEDADDIEATRAVYDLLSRLVAGGHKVDLLDVWSDTNPEIITELDVSLSEVDRESFRFFENCKFNVRR